LDFENGDGDCNHRQGRWFTVWKKSSVILHSPVISYTPVIFYSPVFKKPLVFGKSPIFEIFW